MKDIKELIKKMSSETYTFNHLELNEIPDPILRAMLIEAFRRITLLEKQQNEKVE